MTPPPTGRKPTGRDVHAPITPPAAVAAQIAGPIDRDAFDDQPKTDPNGTDMMTLLVRSKRMSMTTDGIVERVGALELGQKSLELGVAKLDLGHDKLNQAVGDVREIAARTDGRIGALVDAAEAERQDRDRRAAAEQLAKDKLAAADERDRERRAAIDDKKDERRTELVKSTTLARIASGSLVFGAVLGGIAAIIVAIAGLIKVLR